MKYIIILFCLFSFAFAQSNDRMTQDLRVMSEVLYELFQSDLQSAGLRLRSSNQESRYQEGFGVVLYAPALRQSSSNHYLLTTTPVIGGSNKKQSPSKFTATLVAPDTIEKEVVKNLRFFLQQYGDLATALRTSDKVMVVYDPQSNGSATTFYHGRVSGGLASGGNSTYKGMISATARISDIKALRLGNISENIFQERVEISMAQQEEKTQLEYRVFGKILSERLHEMKSGVEGQPEIQLDDDRSLLFAFSTPRVKMKILEGLGATYEIAWGNGYGRSMHLRRSGSGKKIRGVAIIGEDEKGVNEENKAGVNKEVAGWAKKLKTEIPEILVSYGRTLRKLKADEQLTVRIELPACYDCKEPQYMIYSVYGKVLAAYDRNEISLQEAMRKVRIEEEARGEEE